MKPAFFVIAAAFADTPASVPNDTKGMSSPDPRFKINTGCAVTDNLQAGVLKDATPAKAAGYAPDRADDGSVQWSNAKALIKLFNAGNSPFCREELPMGYYWTDTIFAENKSGVWNVNMTGGYVSRDDKTDAYYVRAVHSG